MFKIRSLEEALTDFFWYQNEIQKGFSLSWKDESLEVWSVRLSTEFRLERELSELLFQQKVWTSWSNDRKVPWSKLSTLKVWRTDEMFVLQVDGHSCRNWGSQEENLPSRTLLVVFGRRRDVPSVVERKSSGRKIRSQVDFSHFIQTRSFRDHVLFFTCCYCRQAFRVRSVPCRQSQCLSTFDALL